jgi:hypothetical protein
MALTTFWTKIFEKDCNENQTLNGLKISFAGGMIVHVVVSVLRFWCRTRGSDRPSLLIPLGTECIKE